MTSIEIDGASLTLGGRVVLRDISLSIAGGEFIGVLGPNGAGKTTLLRALLGLVPISAGRIAVLGQPPARGNPAIGYMPQTRALAATRLSGWDVVASAARGTRWGLPLLSAMARRDVAWALDLVDGKDLATRPLIDLSGGERQRLLLAQALLGRPRLLLLDEPLISLDPHHQSGVITLVDRVRRALGITVLFTAHELNPLLGAIDRVLYLGAGHAALGTVAEVITTPVLSRLYGAPIEVAHVNGRIFVMTGDHDAHRHA